ncbi:hypothetical protein [Amycolatopsis sp. NPDC051372]|uniref:hypothetical protein n=1 Tax=unclassified Amycolatopsis TaxID=2618356 RepID=UPI00344A4D79
MGPKSDPNATTAEDAAALRAAGLDDREIFESTTWIAPRLTFATVNDALGAAPDPELRAKVPAAVRTNGHVRQVTVHSCGCEDASVPAAPGSAV